jgi:hypothetical protein
MTVRTNGPAQTYDQGRRVPIDLAPSIPEPAQNGVGERTLAE